MPEIKSGQSNGTFSVTPSGLEIYYQSKPKRLYRVRLYSPNPDYDNWREVPSVSDVLNVLKTPLEWWGQKMGVEGVLELVRNDDLLYRGHKKPHCLITTEPAEATVEDVVELLTYRKLTVNHKRDNAADRGQAVHDALENWAATGNIPNPAIFPEEQQGYVEGLASFLREIPSAEPVATEVMVASAKHGFAGRYDIRVRTTEPHQIVQHRTPVRGPQYAILNPGLYLWDLKTSKDVYPEKHFPQLEGYEGASVESGYEPTDARGVLHVDADGNYKLVRSRTNYQHFLSILDVWKAEKTAKKK